MMSAQAASSLRPASFCPVTAPTVRLLWACCAAWDVTARLVRYQHARTCFQYSERAVTSARPSVPSDARNEGRRLLEDDGGVVVEGGHVEAVLQQTLSHVAAGDPA